MDCWLTLCDFAEVINGKLYIQGGGWSRRSTTGGPFNAAIAGKLLVPWNEANKRLNLKLQLVTDDGQPVSDPEGKPVVIDGEFEIGRPPGLAPGSDLDFPLAFNVGGLNLDVGRYRWEFLVTGDVRSTVAFDVV